MRSSRALLGWDVCRLKRRRCRHWFRVSLGLPRPRFLLSAFLGITSTFISRTNHHTNTATDCKTDVYFNTASLLFPLIGQHFSIWWLDPLGAAILSLYIVYDWADTCLQNVSRLTGSNISAELTKKLMYVAWRFSPVVDGYKSITAYHAGDGVWVEVDILLDEKTSLPKAHDIAETLQYCYEGLKEVDRAFVTVDYSTFGPSGHASESG